VRDPCKIEGGCLDGSKKYAPVALPRQSGALSRPARLAEPTDAAAQCK
jgi:hypothetical protein